MAKYLFVYSGGSMPEGEEAQAAVMAAWEGWLGGLGAAVVDPGNPTGRTATVGAGGSTGTAASPTTGYSLVSAGDFDAAVGLARSCPALAAGGSVEVCEIVEMM